jgi:hypothetical protein
MGTGGHAGMQTESAKVVSIFSSFAILFFVAQKFINTLHA